MCDIEHELRSYTDATEVPTDQDAMAALAAQLASEAHAATMAEAAQQLANAPDRADADAIPF
jgi:hypothetical protein